ncbi:MAG TPA: SGNH/GDSL hydrolase family protein [Gemmatimonadaceae bacterium]|jgi:lysophospholipase L1-like esterase|nr:SGNH/GDSL hydrolase family protein [Gemmatimonadaceae bacterium]
MTRYVTMSFAAAMIALAACDSDKIVNPPATSLNTGIFKSYVAIGNSITAGYQSGGILDSTQQESFAALLAHAAGTRYAYPALVAPGCPPPIVNFQTGARLLNGTATTCLGRDPSKLSAILNNVAVPGAAVADLTALTTANANALTTFILGGKTQIQKALDAQPTFVTVEIGNNDLLPAALTGVPIPDAQVQSPGITPVDSFVVQYARAINQLTSAQPKLKGVLLGVFNVTLIGALFPIDSVINNPFLGGAVDLAAGHAITYAPDCVNSGALLSLEVLPLIAAGEFPPTIGCGDLDPFTLDHNKLLLFLGTLQAYNAYIQAKADSIGFAYMDPNPLLVQLRAVDSIPPYPNFASATHPFGSFITLDGIHPSAAAHQLIAAAMIAKIDSVYGLTIGQPTLAQRVATR